MEEITDRVRAQEALAASEAALRHSHARTRSLAGRLITAQETERWLRAWALTRGPWRWRTISGISRTSFTPVCSGTPDWRPP